jgi:hypothetical protein
MANVRDFVPRTHKRLVIQLHKNEVRGVPCVSTDRSIETHSLMGQGSFFGPAYRFRPPCQPTDRPIITVPCHQVMVEEIAQLFVDVRDGGGHDPHRGEQQRRKGE